MARDESNPLTRSEAVSALREYLTGQWSAADLTLWADDNEMTRHYEDGFSTLIATLLFEFSAPDMNGDITPDRAREWVADLLSADDDGEM
jgi:hypothetical protein